jgi:HlyD family secretion protein
VRAIAGGRTSPGNSLGAPLTPFVESLNLTLPAASVRVSSDPRGVALTDRVSVHKVARCCHFGVAKENPVPHVFPRFCAEGYRPHTHFRAIPFQSLVKPSRTSAVRALGLLGMAAMWSGCARSGSENVAVGTLEMRETNVGPLQAARAERVLVDEGSSVHEGDTLAVFAFPTLAASEDQALARTAAARQNERELFAGPRPAEVAQATAVLAAAEADAERAAADLRRLAPLAAKSDISKQQLDAARATAESAASRRDGAQSALTLIKEGARPERRSAAQQETRSAEAAAAMIRASAKDLVLLSPVAGVVTSRNVEVGEVLGPGQSAVSVGEPDKPWARIYVSQLALLHIKIGDTLSARIDGDSTVYRGRVASIASQAEYTPRVALTDQERADLLFGVKIEFVDTTGRLKAGLPITVTVPARAP